MARGNIMRIAIGKGIHLVLLLGMMLTLPACQPAGESDDDEREKTEQEEHNNEHEDKEDENKSKKDN
jgi:hypothetical protein